MQLKLDSKSQKIEDQQSEITKLRNEQFELKRDKQHLEKDSETVNKSFNKLKSELDQKNLFISKMQTQISHIISFTTFDELPTALFGFKEEFDLQKENNARMQKQINELERSNEEMRIQLVQATQESQSMKNQYKRKEIIDSQIYGVANLQDLPKHFTEMKHNLEETEQRLENMANKCKELSKKLSQSERELFQMRNNNQELTDKNTALMNELNETNTKNSNLEETVESMTSQVHEYEERLYRLENQNSDFREKNNSIEKMLSQIGELVDFESPEKLVDVMTDMKKENDQRESDKINVKKFSKLCQIYIYLKK